MENKLLERAKAFLKAHHNQNIWYRIMCVLASLVVFVTTYMLILPAITMEKETYCGLEEHIHTEDCYQIQENTPDKILDCTYGTLQVHQHTDSCYDENNHLICDQAAYILHTHDANCYNEGGVLVCTLPEIKAHQHTDSCYLSEQVLVCGQQETAGHTHDSGCYTKERGSLICAAEEHAHSEACYDENGNLVCGLQEHQHQDDCYQWAEALTCGQTEQAAHTHSAGCYETRKTLICGYDKLKVSSHQHTEACFREGTAEDTKILVCGMTEHQHSEVCYQENAADLLLEQEAQNAGLVDEEGLIEDMDSDVPLQADGSLPEAGRAYGIRVTALAEESGGEETAAETGLSAEEVDAGSMDEPEAETEKETEISTETEIIGETETEQITETEIQTEMESESETETASEEATEQETETTVDDDFDASEFLTMYAMEDEEENQISLFAAAGESVQTAPLNVTLTDGSASYNKINDTYSVEMRIEFTIDNSSPDTVVQTSYVYNYPAGYPVPAALTEGSHTLYDKSGKSAGTYSFQENSDGTFSVVITISKEYTEASTTGNTITGFVSYKGSLKADECTDENGNLVIGTGDTSITIPAGDIAYPDGETHNYNIQSEKAGEYKVENNQLIYTVKVYSTKGTPDSIDFTDTVTADGLTLDTPTVTVQKMTRKDHQSGWIEDWVVSESTVAVSPQFSNANKTISMTLSKLETPTVDTDNVRVDNGYLITYTYDLSDVGAVSLSANNKVEVSSSGGSNGPTVRDEANSNVTINRSHTFEKIYSYDSTAGTILWTLNVNSNKANIAGAMITDEMFGQAVDGKITVSPASDYSYDSDNKTITFHAESNGTSNNKTYTITYSTPVTSQWDTQTITNNAKFDPTPENPDSGDEIEKNPSITIDGGSVEKTKVSESIASDNQSATVEWKVTINVPASGLSSGTKITDTADSAIQMTKSQVSGWVPVLYWKDANGNDINTEGASYQVPDTQISFVGSDGKQYTLDDIKKAADLDGLTFQLQEITLNASLTPPAGASKLEFTYTTTVDLSSATDGWNKYTNKVTVSGKEGAADFDYEIKTPSLSKTHLTPSYITENGQIKYINIPWIVSIEVPDTGWLSGKVLTDDLTKNQWNNASDAHAITYQNALSMVEGATWENGTSAGLDDTSAYEIKFFVGEAAYTYQQLKAITDNAQKNSLKFTSFTINPLKTVFRPNNETKIILNVTSQADVSEVVAEGSKYYKNWVYIGNNNASDEYQYTNSQNSVKKYDGNWQTGDTSITSSDGKVCWIIVVKLDNQTHSSVSITDTLPEGVSLETLKVSIESKGECYPSPGADGAISAEMNGYIISGTYEEASRVINLTVRKKDNSAIDTGEMQFYINCLANDSLKDQEVHALKNDVTAKVDDAEIGSSSQTQNWTYQEQTVTHNTVSKTGSWDNNARILEYQVAINPDGKDLVQNSDTLLTLIDELTFNHVAYYYFAQDNYQSTAYHFQVNLLQERVKLYYAKLDDNNNLVTDGNGKYQKNGEVTGWSWTFSTQANEWNTKNTLTINDIPDSTPLIIEYAYQVSSDLIDGVQVDLPISNTATLYGQDKIDSSTQSGGKWSEQTTSGGVDSNRRNLKLIKVEQGHYENVLENAEFTVYKADKTSESEDLVWSAIRVYTTNNVGFTIEREEKAEDGSTVEFTYEYNTLYKVVETKAPEGYVIPTPVTEYYFYFSNESDTMHVLPADIPEGAMDLSISAFTVYAENAKQPEAPETTEITVNKEWKDKNGNTISNGLPATVTVQLYQKSGAAVSDEEGSASGTGVSYTANFNYGAKTGTIDNASVGDIVKIVIVYTWNAGDNPAMTGHDWQWSGVADGSGVWSTTKNNQDTYTYTGRITSNDISFHTGDSEGSVQTVTCTVESSGSASASGGTTNEAATGGTAYGDPITLNSPGWSYTWRDLPKTGTQNEEVVNYIYYVQEIPVSGYTTGYLNDGGITAGTITVTNTKDETEPATTSITLNKVWQKQDSSGNWTADTENSTNTISVYLKRSSDGGVTWLKMDSDPLDESDATPYTVSPDSDGDWTLTVSALPVRDENGNSLMYTWEEVQLQSYEPPVYETSTDGKTVTITNKKIPETSITVKKAWEDGMQWQSVDVQLYRYESDTKPADNIGNPDPDTDSGSGTGDGNSSTTITLKAGTVTQTPGDNWWFCDFDGIDAFRNAQDGYFMVYSNNSAIKLIFQGNGSAEWKGAEIIADSVNTASDGTYISKFSRARCMQSITASGMELSVYNKFYLCADPSTNTTVTKVEWTTVTESSGESGSDTGTISGSVPDGGECVGDNVNLSSSCNWTYTWNNLPLYGYKTVTENGEQIQKLVYYTYYVKEETTGYSPAYSEESPLTGGTLLITNHHDDSDIPEYTLPETGGSGTWPYTIGGLLLSAMACLLLYIKNKQRKEEGCSS